MLYVSDSLLHVLIEISHRNHGCLVATRLLRLMDETSEVDLPFNYLSLDREVFFSFLPAGKTPDAHEDEWTSRYRQVGKAGKVIRTLLFSSPIRDSSLETFLYEVDTIREQQLCQFEIVEGGDIRKFYNERNHARGRDLGSLANSCMRYNKCSRFFDLYVNHPDKVKMLVVKFPDDENIVGRALIWAADSGEILVDRIYGRKSLIEAVKRWAQEQGYWHKQQQTYDSPRRWVNPKGEAVTKSFRVTLTNVLVDRMPYLDTFQYLSVKKKCDVTKGVLANYSPHRNSECVIDMQDTEGGLKMSRCELCSQIMYNTNGSKCNLCQQVDRCVLCYQYVGETNLRNRICERCIPAHTCETCGSVGTDIYGRYSDSRLRECSLCARERLAQPQRCPCGVMCDPTTRYTINIGATIQRLCEACSARGVCDTCLTYIPQAENRHVTQTLEYVPSTDFEECHIVFSGSVTLCDSCSQCARCHGKVLRSEMTEVLVALSDGTHIPHIATLCHDCHRFFQANGLA